MSCSCDPREAKIVFDDTFSVPGSSVCSLYTLNKFNKFLGGCKKLALQITVQPIVFTDAADIDVSYELSSNEKDWNFAADGILTASINPIPNQTTIYGGVNLDALGKVSLPYGRLKVIIDAIDELTVVRVVVYATALDKD